MNIEINKNLKTSSVTPTTTIVHKTDSGNFAAELKTLSSKEKVDIEKPTDAAPNDRNVQNDIISDKNERNLVKTVETKQDETKNTLAKEHTDTKISEDEQNSANKNPGDTVSDTGKLTIEDNEIVTSLETKELFETVEQLAKTERKKELKTPNKEFDITENYNKPAQKITITENFETETKFYPKDENIQPVQTEFQQININNTTADKKTNPDNIKLTQENAEENLSGKFEQNSFENKETLIQEIVPNTEDYIPEPVTEQKIIQTAEESIITEQKTDFTPEEIDNKKPAENPVKPQINVIQNTADKKDERVKITEVPVKHKEETDVKPQITPDDKKVESSTVENQVEDKKIPQNEPILKPEITNIKTEQKGITKEQVPEQKDVTVKKEPDIKEQKISKITEESVFYESKAVESKEKPAAKEVNTKEKTVIIEQKSDFTPEEIDNKKPAENPVKPEINVIQNTADKKDERVKITEVPVKHKEETDVKPQITPDDKKVESSTVENQVEDKKIPQNEPILKPEITNIKTEQKGITKEQVPEQKDVTVKKEPDIKEQKISKITEKSDFYESKAVEAKEKPAAKEVNTKEKTVIIEQKSDFTQQEIKQEVEDITKAETNLEKTYENENGNVNLKTNKVDKPKSGAETNKILTGLQDVVEEIKKLNRPDEKEIPEVKKKDISVDKKEKKTEDEHLIDNNINIQETQEKLTPQMNANMNFNSDGQKFEEFVKPQNEQTKLRVTASELEEEKAILSTMDENIAIANKNIIQKQTQQKTGEKPVKKAAAPAELTPLTAIFEEEPEETQVQPKTKTVTTSEGIKKVDKKTNVTVETVVKYDNVIMDKSDVDFFAQLVNDGEIDISTVQNAQKTTQVSKTLADMLAKAMQDNKPIRIDFDNNISVIIKISKDGKISADFLPSSQVAENYLKENLPVLKQRFDDNNIDYDELNHRRQRQDNQENRKKGRKDE